MRLARQSAAPQPKNMRTPVPAISTKAPIVIGVAQVRKEVFGRAASALPTTATVVMVSLLFDPAEWIVAIYVGLPRRPTGQHESTAAQAIAAASAYPRRKTR